MKTKNGTTQDPGGRRKNGQRENESTRLGKHGQDSPVYGINSFGATPLDSSGENTIGQECRTNPNPGKILKRLELIEKTFLSYLHGHQDRLETRLEESRNVEVAFKEELEALKHEIQDLTPDITEHQE
jgi:hypothetical protein